MTETLSDFMLGRTAVGWSQCEGLDCADNVVGILGKLKGWSDDRVRSELAEYKQTVGLRHLFSARKTPGKDI